MVSGMSLNVTSYVHCRSCSNILSKILTPVPLPRGLRRRSATARLLRLWVRIPPEAWMFECCVLSGRGLCDEPITRPEESYRLWCVVCDLETSRMRRPRPTGRLSSQKKETKILTVTLYCTKMHGTPPPHKHAHSKPEVLITLLPDITQNKV